MRQAILATLSAKEFDVVDVIAFSITTSLVASRPDDVHFMYGIMVCIIAYLAIHAIGWVVKKCLA